MKEWCRVLRRALQQNISDVVTIFAATLVSELSSDEKSSGAVANTYGLHFTSKPAENPPFVTVGAAKLTDADRSANPALAALLGVFPTSAVRTLVAHSPLEAPTDASAAPAVPSADRLAPLLAWVPQVVEGWLSDATVVTLLGQMTINAQALTAVPAADAAGTVPTSTANAALEVMQILRPRPQKTASGDNDANDDNEDEDDEEDDADYIVRKSNVHQRVPIFGAALFTLQSCFNHSCAPNAEVVPTLPFGLGGHDIVVQAIPKDKRISSKGAVGGGKDGDDEGDDNEPSAASSSSKDKKEKKDKKSSASSTKVKPLIKEGEEVNITYIPMLFLALEDYNDRRARLESYFFVCECKRCFRENAKAEKAEAKRKTKEAKQQQ